MYFYLLLYLQIEIEEGIRIDAGCFWFNDDIAFLGVFVDEFTWDMLRHVQVLWDPVEGMKSIMKAYGKCSEGFHAIIT